jgi:UDP-N-acetylglucosamine 2-epimerase (non-hydrolysing)
MREVIREASAGIAVSDVLARLGLERDRYILLSAHREENIDIEENFQSLVRAIDALAETYDVPVLYSCHPRAEKMIEQRGVTFDRRVVQSRPFGFFDYCTLQLNALCVVSDSGTLPEESACLKFPAVSIRTSSERPEAVDKGVFILGSISASAVVESVRIAVELHRGGERPSDVPAYADDEVSTKVVKIVQGYTHVVNRLVWRK